MFQRWDSSCSFPPYFYILWILYSLCSVNVGPDWASSQAWFLVLSHNIAKARQQEPGDQFNWLCDFLRGFWENSPDFIPQIVLPDRISHSVWKCKKLRIEWKAEVRLEHRACAEHSYLFLNCTYWCKHLVYYGFPCLQSPVLNCYWNATSSSIQLNVCSHNVQKPSYRLAVQPLLPLYLTFKYGFFLIGWYLTTYIYTWY